MSIFSTGATQAILNAGSITATANELIEISAKLESIAAAIIQERFAHTQMKGRPRKASAVMDDRGRSKTKLGQKVRKLLFGGLAGLWIDLPGIGRIPSVTRNAGADTYTGDFLRFAQAFCGALADYMDTQDMGGAWHSVAIDLRYIQNNGARVREGLRLIGTNRLRSIAESWE